MLRSQEQDRVVSHHALRSFTVKRWIVVMFVLSLISAGCNNGSRRQMAAESARRAIEAKQSQIATAEARLSAKQAELHSMATEVAMILDMDGDKFTNSSDVDTDGDGLCNGLSRVTDGGVVICRGVDANDDNDGADDEGDRYPLDPTRR